MAKLSISALVLIFLAAASQMARPARAINCLEVALALRECIPYLTGQAAEPARACCAGVSHIKEIATTTPDRQAACACMKDAASRVPGIKDGRISALPDKCGVPLPYPISASVDCSQIH